MTEKIECANKECSEETFRDFTELYSYTDDGIVCHVTDYSNYTLECDTMTCNAVDMERLVNSGCCGDCDTWRIWINAVPTYYVMLYEKDPDCKDVQSTRKIIGEEKDLPEIEAVVDYGNVIVDKAQSRLQEKLVQLAALRSNNIE